MLHKTFGKPSANGICIRESPITPIKKHPAYLYLIHKAFSKILRVKLTLSKFYLVIKSSNDSFVFIGSFP